MSTGQAMATISCVAATNRRILVALQPATGNGDDVTRGGGSILIIHNATIFGEPFEIWNSLKLTRQRRRQSSAVHVACWNVNFNLLRCELFDKKAEKNLSKISCQSSLQSLSLWAIKNAHTPRRLGFFFFDGGVVKSERLTTRKLTAETAGIIWQ